MRNFPIQVKGNHPGDQVVVCRTAGDRIWFWGKLGAFWGGFWGLLYGGGAVDIGPPWGCLVGALQGEVVLGGFSAMAAALPLWLRWYSPKRCGAIPGDDQIWHFPLVRPRDTGATAPSQREPRRGRLETNYHLPGERRRRCGMRAFSMRLR